MRIQTLSQWAVALACSVFAGLFGYSGQWWALPFAMAVLLGWGMASSRLMAFMVVFIYYPVSFTHLDVYMREGQFRESNVLRASPEQRVLGRVDAVGSIGYWWQTAERTDVARTFQEGRRRVEEALHLGCLLYTSRCV